MISKMFSRDYKAFAAPLLLSFMIYLVVFFAGGTNTPFPHLCYFPIMLAAILGTWSETLLIALVNALLMSKWVMPLNVVMGTQQSDIGWTFRAGMFLLVAVFLKYLMMVRKQHEVKVIAKNQQMLEFSYTTLRAILHLAETKDPESTGKHLNNMVAYAEALLAELDLNTEEKKNIIAAISLHDIGKVAIPERVLMKPGKLTQDEYEIMKTHSEIGGKILRDIEISLAGSEQDLRKLMQTAADIAYFHHERPDGKGYPYGLQSHEIPLSAKVAAVCDVYDALSSERPYKEAYAHSKCVDIILCESDKQFDPEVVKAFIRAEKKFEEIARVETQVYSSAIR